MKRLPGVASVAAAAAVAVCSDAFAAGREIVAGSAASPKFAGWAQQTRFLKYE